MGWKAVRDHYRIGHIVHVRGSDVLVGSAYVSDLIAIAPDGRLTINRIVGQGGELGRYVEEMQADRALLLDLLARTDVFERSVPVYGWSGAEILEDFCEEPGWPNVTHSGALMYENSFFLERDVAVRHAVASARMRIEAWSERVEEAEEELARKKEALDRVRRDLELLTSRHPAIVQNEEDNRA